MANCSANSTRKLQSGLSISLAAGSEDHPGAGTGNKVLCPVLRQDRAEPISTSTFENALEGGRHVQRVIKALIPTAPLAMTDSGPWLGSNRCDPVWVSGEAVPSLAGSGDNGLVAVEDAVESLVWRRYYHTFSAGLSTGDLGGSASKCQPAWLRTTRAWVPGAAQRPISLR